LPHFAVQLRTELSPFGPWLQTDAMGRVRLRRPLPGRWLLRGTELTPPATDAGAWQGRFVTLAFDVAPAGSAAASPRWGTAAGQVIASPAADALRCTPSLHHSRHLLRQALRLHCAPP
jgi:hypothetical protein